jgi:HD-GYP domain-containing protein (c-di-GMP phosphodiesterase class II)
LGALIATIVCLLFLSGAFDYPELGAIDARYRLRGEVAPSPDIVLVGITQRCLNRLGKFPWPRTYHADLIDFLKKSGVRVIAMDIFFSQRDPDPMVDQRLAEAIRNAGCVVLPVFMPYRILRPRPGDNFIKTQDLVTSISEFTAGAVGEGHINVIPDADGVYRKAPLAIKHAGNEFFCLGAEAAMRFEGVRRNEIRWGRDYLEVRDKKISLEESRFAYINFSDIETKMPRYAFSDVLKGQVPAKAFKDKIVFVGQTTQGLPNADILQTPFKEKYGVTVQANIANTFLGDFYFRKLNRFPACAWIAFLCMVTLAIVVYLNAWAATVLILFEFLAVCLLSIKVFSEKGIIVNFIPLVSSVVLSFSAGILYRIRFADRMVKTKELEVNELFLSSIKALAETIDAKDPYTHGHVERVTADALAIADEMGLSKEEKKRIHVGAILHDIGKIGVKDAVLTKPSQLTSEEKKLFDQHPDIGSRIMKPIIQLESIIPMIRHHHEAYDGTGYPDHLRGEAIPLGARIIAVADTFDAMTSDRPYRKAMPDEAAKAEINKLSGIQFDPSVVAAFNRVYEKGLYKSSARS